MLLLTIILIVIIILHFFIAKFNSIPSKSWFYVLLYIIALDVAPMSHLWHLMYGEDRITCPDRKDVVFGWYPCFQFDWNTLVNTYEITLSVEFLALTSLTFYILFDLFKSLTRNILVFALNAAHMVLTIILLVSPPLFLDSFTYTFDITGFILSLLILVLVELYVRIPYFGYVRV